MGINVVKIKNILPDTKLHFEQLWITEDALTFY